MKDLAVFGDSVTWGQGLREAHKFSAIVAASLGLQPRMAAHSGAIVGLIGLPCNGTAAPGEVPVSCPSIPEQIQRYGGAADETSVVVVNGGINDVDIRRILNPLTSPEDLSAKTRRYCEIGLGEVLRLLLARFPNPLTKIVVTSYFPILSDDSNPFAVPHMMQIAGVAAPAFLPPGPVLGKVVSLCLQFWRESNAAMRNAVAAVNSGEQPRVFFADAGFSERNAVFASNPWLFGLTGILDPADEVADARAPQCDAAFPNDIIAREVCYRASAGHPNAEGAIHYAEAIISVLS